MGSERVYGDPSRWQRAIAHIDMDAFFVSVELLRRPGLRGKPVAIGPGTDPTARGVVAAASYEARRFGVHSALPIVVAKRRCPELILVPRDMELYRRGSRAVMSVLGEFSDSIEVLGLDEAYVDLSDSPAPKTRARQIKLRVRERTRLACSIGLGPNRLIAKIASDLDKPDGLCVLPQERFLEICGDRPARMIPGVGPKTNERLERADFHTVADLATAPEGTLESLLGPNHGAALRLRAAGHGSAEISLQRQRKSESRELTFSIDESDEEVMRESVEEMARRVAERLAAQSIRGRTVTLKIRLAPFRTFTRSRTLDQPTDDPDAIAAAALGLFADFERDAPVRLLGVGVSNLLHPGGPSVAPADRVPEADVAAGTGPVQLALD